MILSIIIPAYNEEESIQAIVRRTLAAAEVIRARTPVEEVEVIVVSDGSFDRTEELARTFLPAIQLIAYPDNRGYGRAIKTGFKRARGELVSFLDADGTCDPLFFVDLVNKLLEEKADICIGSRMGPGSRMPALRRVGNRLFRSLINLIAKTKVTDSASGMRVLRRDRLPDIYPLPDGLHFTPAMTARAALDPKLSIVEVEMTYQEREGRSKLNAAKDGLRFLKVILSVALTYRPLTLLAPPALLLILLALAYGGASLVFYLSRAYVPEESIYRLVSVMVFGVSGVLILGLAGLADKAVNLVYGSLPRRTSRPGDLIRWALAWPRMWLFSPLLVLAGVVLNHQTIGSYFRSGTISTHWVYVVAGGFLVLLGLVGLCLGLIDYLLDLIKARQESAD